MQHQEIMERLERIETAVTAPPKEYLNIKQAADFIGISRQTLDLWRMNAEGPAVHRVGTRVLYSVADDAQELERGGITSMDVAEAHKKLVDG